jgi:hypothetical protein
MGNGKKKKKEYEITEKIVKQNRNKPQAHKKKIR